MQVKKTDREKSQVELEITVPWEEWEKQFDAAVKSLSEKISVEGFRRGRAPRKVIERELGSQAVSVEAGERAIKNAYVRAVRNEKIPAIGAPQIKVKKMKEGEDLVFSATVAVVPKVEFAKGWRQALVKARQKAESENDKKVEDKEVEKELRRLAESRVKLNDVDRPAEKGDAVIIDFRVSRGNVPIEGGTGRDQAVVLGSGSFIPGFEEAIVGLRTGENKEVELKFPEKYHAKHLAGQSAKFAITVKKVQERNIPELNDEFAKSLGSRFDSLEDLRKSVREGMEQEVADKKRQAVRAALAEALAEQVKIDIPQVLIDQELQKMEEQSTQQFAASGLTLENVLEKMGKTKEDLHKEWLSQAEKRVKIGLSLEHLADELELEASADKIQAHINTLLMRYGTPEEAEKKVDIAAMYDYVKASLRQEEVFDYLEKMDS